MKSKVFISYRREDSRASAGRLSQSLRDRFGAEAIFKDVDSVRIGSDFRAEIQSAIEATGAYVIVVGPHFLKPTSDGFVRLNAPDDYVRLEIESALSSGALVCPVLVDGATMPSAEELPSSVAPLVYLTAANIDHDTWDRDCAPLLEVIADVLSEPEATGSETSADWLPVKQALPRPRAARPRFAVHEKSDMLWLIELQFDDRTVWFGLRLKQRMAMYYLQIVVDEEVLQEKRVYLTAREGTVSAQFQPMDGLGWRDVIVSARWKYLTAKLSAVDIAVDGVPAEASLP